MNKKALKKSLAGFMVVAVLSGTMAPMSLIFAADKMRGDNGLVLEKLRIEQPEKDGQLRDFNSGEKMKTFSVDEGLKKMSDVKQLQKQNYVEGEVLVKFKEQKINLEQSSGRTKAMQFAVSKNLDKKEDIRKSNISVLKIKDTKTVEEKIAELKNDSRVEYVQPNYLYYPSSIPTDDTFRDQLWALENTGQTINGTPYSGGVVAGIPNADIDAPEAWAMLDGSEDNIIVAVIDTGVAYNHPDLIDNMWNGNACSGQDINGNTISGGCMHGFDFIDNDKIPLPTTDSHGTHVAGTIGAVKNNNKGIIGVAPNVKIMALKVDLPNGFPSSAIIAAINFAEQNKAKIINASFGGGSEDLAQKNAIASFSGIFVAAAGNDSNDNDGGTHFYPSDFNLSNIISVAATDQNDVLANFGWWGSNYGATSVDVGAPGVNILSTITDTVLLNETFESVTPPNIPSGWIKEGTPNYWGTYNLSGNKVLFGDYANHFPYASNVDTIINSPVINLAESTGAKINFVTACDTELYPPYWDYMAFEISNGGAFTEFFRWNEYSLGSSGYYNVVGALPPEYLTSNFNFRLRWVTDDLFNNYAGCLIDNFQITKYTNGSDEKYDYYPGTSMAAPHVAGLAALIWGYDSELSYSEVKNVILTTGDDLTSLAGKTVTGKRINAFNALNSLVPATHTISGTIKYYDGVKVIPNATVILENDVGEQIAITTTDANGYYEFTEVTSGEDYVVKVSKSDNIVSNGIDVLDLIKLRRHIVEIESFDQVFKNIAADVNNDLSVSVLDLIKMRRYITEIDVLPSGSWKFYSSSATLTTLNYLTEGLTRTYTNLIADTSEQDFIGVKMGDVNNSWSSS